MVTTEEIRRLDKDTIWDKMGELGLIPNGRDVSQAKRELLLWVQIKCDHVDSVAAYDLSCLLCPHCDVLLEFNFDTDMNSCGNCEFHESPEVSGSMDDLETFEWLEKCINCRTCEFKGNPNDEIENPFGEVEELPTW